MHGPLPPDVTLDAPYWWQPGMPLLPPADYMAPVPLKRKRDMSAESRRQISAKRLHTCAYPTRRSCGSWIFHAYHTARVSMAKTSLNYNIRWAKHLVPELWRKRRWARGTRHICADGIDSGAPWSTRSKRTSTADRPRGAATIRPFASCEPHSCRRGQGSVSLSVPVILAARLYRRTCCASSTSKAGCRAHNRSMDAAAFLHDSGCSYHGSSRRLTCRPPQAE